MKSQTEIEMTRERLVTGLREYAGHFHLPTRGILASPEQQWLFALGATAAFNWALELERPDNLGNLISSMEATNKERQSDGSDQTKIEN